MISYHLALPSPNASIVGTCHSFCGGKVPMLSGTGPGSPQGGERGSEPGRGLGGGSPDQPAGTAKQYRGRHG